MTWLGSQDTWSDCEQDAYDTSDDEVTSVSSQDTPVDWVENMRDKVRRHPLDAASKAELISELRNFLFELGYPH